MGNVTWQFLLLLVTVLPLHVATLPSVTNRISFSPSLSMIGVIEAEINLSAAGLEVYKSTFSTHGTQVSLLIDERMFSLVLVLFSLSTFSSVSYATFRHRRDLRQISKSIPFQARSSGTRTTVLFRDNQDNGGTIIKLTNLVDLAVCILSQSWRAP